ncbi:uncharacterized protein LOC117917862 isoform X1 [Vitis riparia]|uniref:uncharacterized protein LOC117917862 isoform X1 n=2 Tax=Vitis riparia TaxID=96939 RepID=UPI00155A2E15|nr:uncharacterized protein LOC117917862 isoform X1 [Vitis riparia]
MAEHTGSGSTKNDEVRRILFDYAMQGKWDEAVKVYEQQPWLRPEKITEGGDTPLHIAVRDHQEWVVEKMVELVRTHSQQSEDVLKSKNKKGNTPLHLAASIGNVSMCQCFTKERNDLVGICNEDGENPLFLAARHGKIKAFICLLDKAWEPDLASSVNIHRRNKKGETILHCAIAGGHFELAFLIIKRYKDLGSSRDEKGVSPLHLLASQPTAFRSGTRLSLFDKIIYHCIFVLPTHFGDAKKSDNPAERQTLVKLLPVPWNNIKGLFFLIVKFIKICINPSGGEKAENARRALDEETPAQAIFEQGPASTPGQGAHEHSKEDEKKVGLSQRPDDLRNFPVNYDTCFNFIRLLIQAILLVLGIGRGYINKIQKKKEKHVWSAKILEKLLDKGKGHWYDSTGKDPVYTDRTILYEGENSMEAPWSVLPGETPENVPEYEESSKEGTSEKGVGNVMHKQVESSTNLMHKLLEEAQRSTGLIHELLVQAHRLPTMNESNQKWHKSIKEDSNLALMQTMCKAVNQTAKKLGDELLSGTENKNQETEKLRTPVLIAAKNGIKEMVESILDCSPMAIHDASPEKKNIVLLAVENRHPHLYKVLLKRVNNMTDSVFGAVDDNGNSALHLAAMFTDNRPRLIPGAALQMQWEVKWFEYVRNSRPPNFFPILNNNNESPQQIFTDNHKDLVQKGGEWLNNTATSCSVVSTLIATVAFATSTTLPGGNMDITGLPVLELKPAFHLFAISSLVALCSSITSTIMFLAILTSRQQEKDFAKDLPAKLLVGLTTLFLSILAILVSFCSAHFFVLQKELRTYALPIYAVTCLPVTLFAIAQLPLYVDLIWTTFSTVPQLPLEDNT